MRSMLYFWCYVHGKKAKELKQGVRLEDGGHTGSLPTPTLPPKTSRHADHPHPSPQQGFAASGKVRCTSQ